MIPADKRIERLTQVARMYYEQNMNQSEIGNTATDCMRLSFSTIPNPVRSITKTAKDSVKATFYINRYSY